MTGISEGRMTHRYTPHDAAERLPEFTRNPPRARELDGAMRVIPWVELREWLTEIYNDARRFDGVCRWCEAPPPDDVSDHDVACPAAKIGYALHLPGYDDWQGVIAALNGDRRSEEPPRDR